MKRKIEKDYTARPHTGFSRSPTFVAGMKRIFKILWLTLFLL